MEEAIAIVAIVLGVLGCGLMAGVFFAFSTFVMKALAAIPPSEAIRAMQAINRVIVRTAFMPIFIGTAVLCLGLLAGAMFGFLTAHSTWVSLGSVAYLVGGLGVTILGNVPLNNRLDRLDADTPAAHEMWRHYLDRWLLWNHVRTVSCTIACGAFACALV